LTVQVSQNDHTFFSTTLSLSLVRQYHKEQKIVVLDDEEATPPIDLLKVNSALLFVQITPKPVP